MKDHESPVLHTARWDEFIDIRPIAKIPAAKGATESRGVSSSRATCFLAMLRTRVAHPTRADVSTGVPEHPIASCHTPAPRREGWMWGKVADGVVLRMLRFGVEIATGDTDPNGSVGISAGQGRASGVNAPARGPQVEDEQGLRCLHRVPCPVLVNPHNDGLGGHHELGSKCDRKPSSQSARAGPLRLGGIHSSASSGLSASPSATRS